MGFFFSSPDPYKGCVICPGSYPAASLCAPPWVAAKNERDAGKTAARRRRSRAWRRRGSGEKVLGLQPAACRVFTLSRQHQRGDRMQGKAMHQRPSPSPQGTQCQGAYLNLTHSCTVGYVFEKQAGQRAWKTIAVAVFVLPVCLKWSRETYRADKMCSWLRKKKKCLHGVCWKTFHCQSIQSVFKTCWVLFIVHETLRQWFIESVQWPFSCIVGATESQEPKCLQQLFPV